MKKTDKIEETVFVHNQDYSAGYSSIFCSDSEYGLLLMMDIPDSYALNLTSEETWVKDDVCMNFLGVDVGI